MWSWWQIADYYSFFVEIFQVWFYWSKGTLQFYDYSGSWSTFHLCYLVLPGLLSRTFWYVFSCILSAWEWHGIHRKSFAHLLIMRRFYLQKSCKITSKACWLSLIIINSEYAVMFYSSILSTCNDYLCNSISVIKSFVYNAYFNIS